MASFLISLNFLMVQTTPQLTQNSRFCSKPCLLQLNWRLLQIQNLSDLHCANHTTINGIVTASLTALIISIDTGELAPEPASK